MTDFHPTTRDLQAWRLLCKRAREAAANPTGPGGDLKAASRLAFKAGAPNSDVQRTICQPFVRLAESWAPMNDAARTANAPTLLWLANALGPLVGAPEAHQVVSARKVRAQADPRPAGLRLGLHLPAGDAVPDPRPAPEPRRDIWG